MAGICVGVRKSAPTQGWWMALGGKESVRGGLGIPLSPAAEREKSNNNLPKVASCLCLEYTAKKSWYVASLCGLEKKKTWVYYFTFLRYDKVRKLVLCFS